MSTAIRSLSARTALASSAVAIAALAALHVLSPEFDPSWRMISEYATGKHAWAITLFFFAWAVSSWALAVALWGFVSSWPARIGVVFLALSGVGEFLGGLYDVNHPNHGLAFGLGVPTLPVAALFVGISLGRRDGARGLLWLAQAPWLSVVLMGASFGLLFSSAKAAGIPMEPGKPWDDVPAGVTAIMGWTNRLLVLAYVAWTAFTARHVLTTSRAP